jgi:hypothetical protein
MKPEDQAHFTLEPVTPVAFVGREAETALVLSRAHQRVPPLQSLEGPSKIGRTSMLLHLRATSRARMAHDATPGEPPLIAPYVDLTLRPYEETTAESLVLRAIAGEMREHGFEVPEPGEVPAAMTKIATSMTELVSAETPCRFLLLVDHAEHLLVRAGEPGRERWSRQAFGALGELNERVRVGMAVLLAFGATGPARELRASARRLKMLEQLDALSQILNRGNATRISLDPLTDAEVRAFAKRAVIPNPRGGVERLSKKDVEWVVDLAGGHPLVMQNAGVRLAEAYATGHVAKERADLERQLADPGLQGFMIDAFRRIGPLAEGSSGKLEALADGETVDLAPDLAAGLDEEGLIRFVNEGMTLMPSQALRMALRTYLKAAESMPAAEGDFLGRPHNGNPILALRDDETNAELSLTAAEHHLIEVLLQTDDGGVATREALKAAVGPNTTDAHLTQRVSTLRQKIARALGVKDPIESVYGEGYRLTDAQRYVLR